MPVKTIPCDYHSHNRRCGHAVGELNDYVEAALSLGMREVGLSDHNPAWFAEGDQPMPSIQMAKSELPNYVAEAQQLKERYAGRITVKLGIEADFFDGEEAERGLDAFLKSQPFDYVLGSVHFVRRAGIFDRSRWERENAEETYAEYYRLVALAAKSGRFDILSHLTAVEAYGPAVSGALAARLYTPVAEAAAAAGCVVEVNTSGYRKMGGDDPFPNRRMLRLLVDAGVPLTFGGDSHQPGEVGYARDRVLALLRDLGVRADEPEPITVRRQPLLAFRTR